MISEWLFTAGGVIASGGALLFGYRTFRLSQLQIAKEKAEADALKRADLSANFYTLGASKQRLKIFNKGKATARNVRIDFPDGVDCISSDEIDAKFPLESLAVHQAVELQVRRYLGMTKVKYTLQICWSDEFREDNAIVLHLTM